MALYATMPLPPGPVALSLQVTLLSWPYCGMAAGRQQPAASSQQHVNPMGRAAVGQTGCWVAAAAGSDVGCLQRRP